MAMTRSDDIGCASFSLEIARKQARRHSDQSLGIHATVFPCACEDPTKDRGSQKIAWTWIVLLREPSLSSRLGLTRLLLKDGGGYAGRSRREGCSQRAGYPLPTKVRAGLALDGCATINQSAPSRASRLPVCFPDRASES